MSSRNHPALGSVGSWLYQALLGIRVGDEASADFNAPGLYPGEGSGVPAQGMGWSRAVVAPEIVHSMNLTACKGAVRGPRGAVAASWEFNSSSSTLILNASFPVGVEQGEVRPTPYGSPFSAATAVVRETAGCGGSVVWERGAFVSGCTGLVGGRVCGRDGARVCIFTGSGAFSFSVTTT